MSQRTALLISTALTVLTLLGGIGLAIRVIRADPAPASFDAAAPPEAASTLDADLIDRLQASNAALANSYERIAALLTSIDRLQGQNAAMREREAIYQARLSEANRRLAEMSQQDVVSPPAALLAPAPLQPATGASAASLIAPTPLRPVAAARPVPPPVNTARTQPAVIAAAQQKRHRDVDDDDDRKPVASSARRAERERD